MVDPKGQLIPKQILNVSFEPKNEQIMPTNYYWHPEMFSRPSGIPDLNSLYDKSEKFWDPLTWSTLRMFYFLDLSLW